MSLKFASHISRETLKWRVSIPDSEKEDLLLFAARIIQICSDLHYQPESNNDKEKDSQTLVTVESSENVVKSGEFNASRGHHIEVAGPPARAQTSEAAPESIKDAADDVLQMILELDEPNHSPYLDAVELSGPKSPLNNTGVELPEDKNGPANLLQVISNARNYSIYRDSESERKAMEPRTTAPMFVGMDQSTGSQQLKNTADNSKAGLREINSHDHPVSRTHRISQAEAPIPRVLRPSNRTKPVRFDKLLAESGEETHDEDVAIDSSDTGLSHSTDPANHRVRSPNSIHTCTYCGKQELYKSCLVKHLRKHTVEKPFPCTVCDKCFSRAFGLSRHLRTHTGEKPFPCTFCEKWFSQSFHLKTHLRTHTGEKPFSCTLCEKRFSQSSNLRDHLRMHTGEKPFPCTFCEKRFSLSSPLRKHLRIHTGEKPYGCTTCGRSFSSQGGLHTHTRTHTGEKPFECMVCGKHFGHTSSLVRHKKTHTGEKP